MSERVTFKQADLTRALKGFVAAKVPVGMARIAPDGTIEIVVSDNSLPEPKGWGEE